MLGTHNLPECVPVLIEAGEMPTDSGRRWFDTRDRSMGDQNRYEHGATEHRKSHAPYRLPRRVPGPAQPHLISTPSLFLATQQQVFGRRRVSESGRTSAVSARHSPRRKMTRSWSVRHRASFRDADFSDLVRVADLITDTSRRRAKQRIKITIRRRDQIALFRSQCGRRERYRRLRHDRGGA